MLYLGSGIGLTVYRWLIHAPVVHLPTDERLWLVGAIVAGGILGPVLLMVGLTGLPASGASLLLNAEGVFTALLAWFAFKENFDRRIALVSLFVCAVYSRQRVLRSSLLVLSVLTPLLPLDEKQPS